MSRGFKQGVDFIPIDVDIFNDNKIFLLQEKYPCKGVHYLLNIWVEIYKYSYYLEWDATTKIKFCRQINVPQTEFTEVLEYIIDLDLFNRKLFDKYGILTSGGIQERWIKAVKRRSSVLLIREYILIKQDIIDAAKIKGLSIESLSGESEEETKVPFYEAPVVPDSPPIDPPQPPTPPPAPIEGGHTSDFVQEFIKVPYEERTDIFKQNYNVEWYNSYQKFYNLIFTEYRTLLKSEYQISLLEYKNLWKEFKFDKADMENALDALSASGNIHVDTVMKNKFKAFIKPIMERKKRITPAIVGKKVKEIILHDSTKNDENNL